MRSLNTVKVVGVVYWIQELLHLHVVTEERVGEDDEDELLQSLLPFHDELLVCRPKHLLGWQSSAHFRGLCGWVWVEDKL